MSVQDHVVGDDFAFIQRGVEPYDGSGHIGATRKIADRDTRAAVRADLGAGDVSRTQGDGAPSAIVAAITSGAGD